MLKKNLIKANTVAILFALITGCSYRVQQPADYVNPFIGASTNMEKAGASHGLGKTFPGAATPFGLTQTGISRNASSFNCSG